MFGLGLPELVIILLIVLFLFGASRLPEVAKGLGSSIAAFKKGLNDSEKEISESRGMDKNV